MINAFYSSVTGAKSAQTRLDITANNIANANTVGFKAQQAAFTDLVYTNLTNNDEAAASLKAGNGVKISGASSLLDQGNVEYTHRPFDLAIIGDGYFAVGDNKGNISYTRTGGFCLQKNGEDNYLMTSGGDYVLNSDLSPIIIADPSKDIQFTTATDEEVLTFDADSATASANLQTVNIGIFSFANPYALSLDGYGKLFPTAASGEAELLSEAEIRQGALEGSNVDISQQMSELIKAQRGFQLNSKVIQAVDEMEALANSLR